MLISIAYMYIGNNLESMTGVHNIQIVKVEIGKPLIRRRRKKVEQQRVESEALTQGNLFVQEGRNTQHKSSE